MTCCAAHKEEPGVPGSIFHRGWGTRWWRAVVVGQDGKVGVHGDVTVGRSGSEMLVDDWNFSWDGCRESDEKDADVGEVRSLVGSADGIW